MRWIVGTDMADAVRVEFMEWFYTPRLSPASNTFFIEFDTFKIWNMRCGPIYSVYCGATYPIGMDKLDRL